jgi:hypothetical protein
MDGTCRLLSNPTSSDASNWGVLAWNPVSSKTANSDDFLVPDDPESRRIRTDPKIGSDRFRLYESDRKAVNPISGYQRKTVDVIGIWWKVTDGIRLAVLHRNWNPPDRIRRTRFDLGYITFLLKMFMFFMRMPKEVRLGWDLVYFFNNCKIITTNTSSFSNLS